MKVYEQKHGGVTVVRPEGPLIDEEAQRLRSRLEQVHRASMGRFVLDLGATPFVDSGGLESLLEVSEAMGGSGRVLCLCAVNETVREVLELTELSNQFDFYDDANAAVRSFL